MDAVVENSRDIITKGSKSFAAAAKLFDDRTRDQAYMLYAWCRHCDDEIDGQILGFRDAAAATGDPRARLEQLYEKTYAAMRGQPTDDPVFEAFQRVIADGQIPEHHPIELLEGFVMDVEGREYHDLKDTLLYCYHVAGVVGVMMSMVMGARDPETLNRASDLGIAFQLTNISRDVIEDAEAGRIYLPLNWLKEAGVPPENLTAPEHREAVASVVNRLLDEAERYYASSTYGLCKLGFRSAWAIAAARGVYRDIGRLVSKRGAQAWDDRAIVSTRRKMYWAGRSFVTAARAVTARRVFPSPPRLGLWTKSPSRA